MKNLNVEVASQQAKNWETINKLREIDAYLIHYYSNKTKKRESIKDKVHNKSGIKIDTMMSASETPQKAQKQNDKNIKPKIEAVKTKEEPV